jgi:hypothetical protein
MGREEWEAPLGVEHVFSTGRSALLRRRLPVSDLARGAWSPELIDSFGRALSGSLDSPGEAAALNDAIVVAMFLEPRITLDGAEGTVPIAVLEEAEIEETIAVALGVAADASFRGVRPGVDAGGDGEGVGRDAVESDRLAGVGGGSDG